jgi:hypothetical protein
MELPTPQQLEELDDHEAYFETLEIVLSKRLLAAEAFELEMKEIIKDFRTAGHELGSFDSDGDWEIWCGNWMAPVMTTRLIVEFNRFTGVKLYWSGRSKGE